MQLLRTGTASSFVLGVLMAISLGVGSRAEAQSGNAILDAPGLQANHHYSSALPFEHIDTATGSLVLMHTDLVLPGNGGRDLKFQRAWNNKTQRWSYGIADIPLALTYTWPAMAPLSEDPDPTYVMADGSSHAMAFQLDPSPTVNGRRYMIDDRFWLFDRASGVLWMSDGWSAIYSSDGHLATVYDPFGNIVLTATWDTDGIGTDGIVFKHYVSLTGYREITQTWSGCDGFTCQERTMTYAGRVWTYSQPTPTSPTTVTLPEGLTWTYEDTTALLKVTTPYGGRVDYTFEDVEFPDFPELGETTYTEVTKTRKTYTADGTLEGTTTYAYSFGTPEYSTSTVVTSPDGTTSTFEHEYLGTVEEAYRGQTFVVTGRVVEKGGVTLEQETREYAEVSAQSGTMPALSRSTVTRGPATYSTTYCYATSNYGDYRRPYKIIEDGDLDRTIVREYAHTWDAPTTRNVLGMVTRERVIAAAAADCTAPVSGQTVETTRTYDMATGFVTVETAGGIATTFTRDDFGNVRRITKANGTWMEHAYTNGVVSGVTTSESGYQISRVVNADGTVASETQAGRTTSYGYDDLGRVELIDPPLGNNNTTTTYSATSITTTRGTSPVVSSVTTTLDGFGRPIGTLDAAQVRTRTTYDAMGRVTYQSLPYDNGQLDRGTEFTYDGLGRVTREEHADGTFRTFAYDGNVTTATDENSHVTVLTHKSSNASEGGVLVSLLDPAGVPGPTPTTCWGR